MASSFLLPGQKHNLRVPVEVRTPGKLALEFREAGGLFRRIERIVRVIETVDDNSFARSNSKHIKGMSEILSLRGSHLYATFDMNGALASEHPAVLKVSPVHKNCGHSGSETLDPATFAVGKIFGSFVRLLEDEGRETFQGIGVESRQKQKDYLTLQELLAYRHDQGFFTLSQEDR